MIDESCMKEKFNPLKKLKNYLIYKFKFNKEHPQYFYADGLTCFCGAQGSGKTLSAVNYVYKLLEKYPQAKLITNIELRDHKIVDLEEYINNNLDVFETLKENIGEEKAIKEIEKLYLKNNRVFEFKNNDDFEKYNNGEKGVIFLVDEIQLYMNSLQSKNINIDVITQISQQRKQRKHIVATSQIFGRMAKPLREQFSTLILCKNYMGFLQCNQMLDRDSLTDDDSTGTNIKGTVKRKFWFIHSPEYFQRYDTYRVIKTNKFTAGEDQKEIYNSNTIINNNNIETERRKK